jgi:hypothetical protein
MEDSLLLLSCRGNPRFRSGTCNPFGPKNPIWDGKVPFEVGLFAPENYLKAPRFGLIWATPGFVFVDKKDGAPRIYCGSVNITTFVDIIHISTAIVRLLPTWPRRITAEYRLVDRPGRGMS